MHSPFDTVMTTPVLDAPELARLMRHHASRAGDGAVAGCRDDEEDGVLLGRLLMLDELAWRMESREMSETEGAGIRSAAHEVGRAVEILTGRMVESSRRAVCGCDEGDGGSGCEGCAGGLERVDGMRIAGSALSGRWLARADPSILSSSIRADETTNPISR